MEHASSGAVERLAAQIEGTPAQWRPLGFLALAELLAMTLWFSASAVVPTLKEDWDLSSAGAACDRGRDKPHPGGADPASSDVGGPDALAVNVPSTGPWEIRGAFLRKLWSEVRISRR